MLPRPQKDNNKGTALVASERSGHLFSRKVGNGARTNTRSRLLMWSASISGLSHNVISPLPEWWPSLANRTISMYYPAWKWNLQFTSSFRVCSCRASLLKVSSTWGSTERWETRPQPLKAQIWKLMDDSEFPLGWLRPSLACLTAWLSTQSASSCSFTAAHCWPTSYTPNFQHLS